MLYPTIFNDRLFDDLFDMTFPTMDVERKLYGKNAAHVMRTDVHENENGFEVDIDLPGFKKDEISLSLENGCLTITAAKGLDKDEEDKRGRLIRSERYAGTMQRSFYIGKNVTEDEIKARFEDGVLKLTIPKKDEKKLPEKKTIMIEG
ncbi:MAG: Hsp20/alpha crystallin family protein [Clostridiales bacterium]|nr:Hsp20/alpha crystallin family protein [Clostridiales bacterium]